MAASEHPWPLVTKSTEGRAALGLPGDGDPPATLPQRCEGAGMSVSYRIFAADCRDEHMLAEDISDSK
jgi:hypothetical protein